MHNIADNFDKVMHRIDVSVKSSKLLTRNPRLLAVSKGQSSQAIREAYHCGLREFGENYLQEALTKIQELNDLEDIQWHFIGPVQSNKTRHIAENFSWIHSVDRLKIAERLSSQRPAHLPDLNICLQVNIDNEPSKSGVPPAETGSLALAVSQLPRIKLRGLMAIPDPDRENPGRPFAALRALFQELKSTHPCLKAMDTLSMGMSSDLEAAIAEGATIVRIGTDLFGPRRIPQQPATDSQTG